MKEPVASVLLCVLEDGSVLIDPSTKWEDATCERLFAGTHNEILMMEFWARFGYVFYKETCMEGSPAHYEPLLAYLQITRIW